LMNKLIYQITKNEKLRNGISDVFARR